MGKQNLKSWTRVALQTNEHAFWSVIFLGRERLAQNSHQRIQGRQREPVQPRHRRELHVWRPHPTQKLPVDGCDVLHREKSLRFAKHDFFDAAQDQLQRFCLNRF